jgi:hypothetical protein
VLTLRLLVLFPTMFTCSHVQSLEPFLQGNGVAESGLTAIPRTQPVTGNLTSEQQSGEASQPCSATVTLSSSWLLSVAGRSLASKRGRKSCLSLLSLEPQEANFILSNEKVLSAAPDRSL